MKTCKNWCIKNTTKELLNTSLITKMPLISVKQIIVVDRLDVQDL